MSAVQQAGVIQFYDTHPINEDEIFAKLSARGTSFTAAPNTGGTSNEREGQREVTEDSSDSSVAAIGRMR